MHPVRLVRMILGITTMIRPTEGGVFPVETMIMVVLAVSAAVAAAVPARMRLPSVMSPAFRMLGMFTVSVAVVIGDLGVSGSIGRGPGKPTNVRDRLHTFIVRGRVMFFIGLEPLTVRVRRVVRDLHVLFGTVVEALASRWTMVVCIHGMSREIAETLIVRMMLSL